MFRRQQFTLLLGLLLLLPVTHAEDIIFFQDFGCDGGPNDNCGAATTPQTWNLVQGVGGPGSTTDVKYQSTDLGVTETIYADRSTRNEGGGVPNDMGFSVTGRNWDIHDGDDNPYVAGYHTQNQGGGTITADNPLMSGNMLGHEDENYDNHEDNYYQIDGIQLATNIDSAQLMFDFDSWINALVDGHSDVDGFAVAIATGGGNFSRLDPTVASDMQYRLLGEVNDPDGNLGDGSLNNLIGESTSTNADIFGFDGHVNLDPGNLPPNYNAPIGNGVMAGTAMFDLSGLAGETISLRFAFATNSSGALQEGINIDNIKVTQTCTDPGSGPACNPPGGGEIPEPASLALALIGLTAAYRRRRKG